MLFSTASFKINLTSNNSYSAYSRFFSSSAKASYSAAILSASAYAAYSSICFVNSAAKSIFGGTYLTVTSKFIYVLTDFPSFASTVPTISPKYVSFLFNENASLLMINPWIASNDKYPSVKMFICDLSLLAKESLVIGHFGSDQVKSWENYKLLTGI